MCGISAYVRLLNKHNVCGRAHGATLYDTGASTGSLRLPHRFFYAVSFPLLVAGIGYMLNYMPAANVSWVVKVDVALSW